MRFFTPLAFMAFTISVCAVPITPAAPELQRRAEQFRLEGLKEWEIAEKLSLPPATSTDEAAVPIITRISTKINELLHDCSEGDDHHHDLSGDIPPGSLEAPQMLPRPTTVVPSTLGRFVAFLKKGDDEERFAYEGKELELRRPTGMRHWGAQDKWRLF